ncbi:hypothetical protein [Streptomyces sp. SID13031]|uniref:hypothetical protein n=1 Tax=Streptomyces sp. SID13031 TaxID=2706046 RepID=UPI0013C8C462|nr:hypothetical protein [Streptomyces sp. SID13031]NEA30684.1 hypothetical protein [Streptomyces sp. SID13031]
MTENPLFPTAPKAAAAAKLRSNQEVVFIEVGARQIESNVVRNGVPISVHEIDPDILNDIVIGEPIILYRIVGQSVRPGTPVPLDTVVDLTLARPDRLPVGIVRGVHESLRQTTISDAFNRLVRGKPQAQRLVVRAAEGPLSAVDEQALKDLFLSGDVTIEQDVPGRDVQASIETLKMLTSFGNP